jgi:hypothetical protein
MAHFAVAEMLGESAVTWMEKVSDTEYALGISAKT